MAPAAVSTQDVDRQDKGPAILAITWTLTAFAIFFVAARLFTRARIIRHLGFDDWLIIISMLIGTLFVALITGAVDAGMGRHTAALTAHEQSRAQMLNAASFAPGILSFSVPKLAVAALMTKVLNPTMTHRVLLWLFSAGTTIFASGCILIFWIQCSPTRTLWDPTVKNPRCWDPHLLVNYSIFVGTLSAAADLYLAVYPATVLWKLQMHRRKKLGLSVALGLGSIACLVTIYKCTRLPGLLDRSDSTYSTVDLFVWTSIESNTIIIAACIPTLQPLLERLFGRSIFSSSRYYRDRIEPGNYYPQNSHMRSNNGRTVTATRSRAASVSNISGITRLKMECSPEGDHIVEMPPLAIKSTTRISVSYDAEDRGASPIGNLKPMESFENTLLSPPNERL